MREGTRLFKVLASDRRLMIINLLHLRSELSVGSIAQGIKLSLKSTSKHLLILERAGLVASEQKSRAVYYRLNQDWPVFRKALARLIFT